MRNKLSEDTTILKVGLLKIEGRFDAFEEKVKGIEVRVNNQEFLNRAVVIGIILALLSGAAKMFGIIGNS